MSCLVNLSCNLVELFKRYVQSISLDMQNHVTAWRFGDTKAYDKGMTWLFPFPGWDFVKKKYFFSCHPQRSIIN